MHPKVIRLSGDFQSPAETTHAGAGQVRSSKGTAIYEWRIKMASMNDIKIKKLKEDTVLKVRIIVTKEFRLRMWLALKLMRLSSFILGCGIEVEKSDNDHQINKPSPGLLASMAMRLHHGFGLLPDAAKAHYLSDARRLLDEVSGNGFYHPECEHEYAAMFPEPLKSDPHYSRLFDNTTEGAKP
jgi:hypothetical protein